MLNNPETGLTEAHGIWGLTWTAYVGSLVAHDHTSPANESTRRASPLSADATGLMEDFLTHYPTDTDTSDMDESSSSGYELIEPYDDEPSSAFSLYATPCSPRLAALDLGGTISNLDLVRHPRTRPSRSSSDDSLADSLPDIYTPSHLNVPLPAASVPPSPSSTFVNLADSDMESSDSDTSECTPLLHNYSPHSCSSSPLADDDIDIDNEFISGPHDMPLQRGARLLPHYCQRDSNSENFYDGSPACFICEDPIVDCPHSIYPQSSNNIATVGDDWVQEPYDLANNILGREREREFRERQTSYRRWGDSSILPTSRPFNGSRPNGNPNQHGAEVPHVTSPRPAPQGNLNGKSIRFRFDRTRHGLILNEITRTTGAPNTPVTPPATPERVNPAAVSLPESPPALLPQSTPDQVHEDAFEKRFDIPSRHNVDTEDIDIGSMDSPLLIDPDYFNVMQPRVLEFPRSIDEVDQNVRVMDYWASRINSLRSGHLQVQVGIKRISFAIIARGWASLDMIERTLVAQENRVSNIDCFRNRISLTPSAQCSLYLNLDKSYGLSAIALRRKYVFPYGNPILHDDEAAFLYYAMLVFRAHKRNSIAFAIERLLNLQFTDSRPVRFLLRHGFLDRGVDGRFPDISTLASLSPERCAW